MEYLVIAVILYFILRTAGNLVDLLRGGEGRSAGQRQVQRGKSRGEHWEGPSPRNETGAARDEPTYWGKDIEDATWYDIEDTSAVH